METIAIRRPRTLATSKGNSAARNVTDPDKNQPYVRGYKSSAELRSYPRIRIKTWCTRYREDGFSGTLLAHLLPQTGPRWRDGTRASA